MRLAHRDATARAPSSPLPSSTQRPKARAPPQVEDFAFLELLHGSENMRDGTRPDDLATHLVQENCCAQSATRRALSSNDKSSTRVITAHLTPKGSTIEA